MACQEVSGANRWTTELTAMSIGLNAGPTPADLPSPGIKSKVENKGQYEQYLEELKPLREELGVPLKEELYPEEK